MIRASVAFPSENGASKKRTSPQNSANWKRLFESSARLWRAFTTSPISHGSGQFYKRRAFPSPESKFSQKTYPLIRDSQVCLHESPASAPGESFVHELK